MMQFAFYAKAPGWKLFLAPQLQEEMYIFMEYCDEGTLEEVSRLGLQEHVIRLYTKQITTAINVLHEHGIVHRDIKGERYSWTGGNILAGAKMCI